MKLVYAAFLAVTIIQPRNRYGGSLFVKAVEGRYDRNKLELFSEGIGTSFIQLNWVVTERE